VKRTNQQNKSLHIYLALVAGAMADAGYDMKQVVKLPIRPNKDNVKEEMFKPVMNNLYPDKTSTTELSTTEMQDVYEVFNVALSQKLGIGFDWPCNDSLMNQQEKI